MSGIRPLLFAVLLLPLLAACSSSRSEPEPSWQTTQLVDVPSDGVLWKVALYSCEKVGFPLAMGLDPSTMEITTAWRTDLQPFSRDGNRTQAHVKMTPVGPGQWQVTARVKKQINVDLMNPLDPRRAKWEWVADDTTTAAVLVHHIRAYLDPRIDPKDRPADEVDAALRRAGLDGK